eukprot:GHVP01069113.1.p1 GENE.GHVP01069113.1~~GHVP01069113.1.p1  ORF type:complete len:138 (+),score=10.29 GHVP01069113.1:518-931(+)
MVASTEVEAREFRHAVCAIARTVKKWFKMIAMAHQRSLMSTTTGHLAHYGGLGNYCGILLNDVDAPREQTTPRGIPHIFEGCVRNGVRVGKRWGVKFCEVHDRISLHVGLGDATVLLVPEREAAKAGRESCCLPFQQ